MRYFTYIAEQSFKTAPSGERVFFDSGPWSRPYVLPNAETEQRIYRKLVWMLRIMLGGLIVSQPILLLWFPGIVNNPMVFAAYLIALTAVFGLVRHALLAPDLRGLARAERVPMRSFYGEMARQHSLRALMLGLACSIAFVALGAVMLALGQSSLAAIFCIVFFGACAVAWMYGLMLKRRAVASSQ
jgi:hypothetical protein